MISEPFPGPHRISPCTRLWECAQSTNQIQRNICFEIHCVSTMKLLQPEPPMRLITLSGCTHHDKASTFLLMTQSPEKLYLHLLYCQKNSSDLPDYVPRRATCANSSTRSIDITSADHLNSETSHCPIGVTPRAHQINSNVWPDEQCPEQSSFVYSFAYRPHRSPSRDECGPGSVENLAPSYCNGRRPPSIRAHHYRRH